MVKEEKNVETVKSELSIVFKDQIDSQTDKLKAKIIQLEKMINQNLPQASNGDNNDILINTELKNINYSNRPQTSNNTSLFNKKFKDLSNHELHRIKEYMDKENPKNKKTILDENLGDIMNNLVNFISFSMDGYNKALYEAEIMENINNNDKSIYQTIKIHLISLVLFIREDQNVLYIGIILIFFSMILYLMNITTS